MVSLLILGLVLGAGIGALTSFDPGSSAGRGVISNALRQARNDALAYGAPSRVTFDPEAGTLRSVGFRIAGTWRFERGSLDGSTPVSATVDGFAGPHATLDGFIGEGQLVKAYNDTLAKMSEAGDDITQGFSDLDELLTRAGPILDETKPILMPTDLLFGYNEAELQESARLSLMKLGLLIQKNPASTFIIEGHTDTTGSSDYNLALSRLRAVSVQSWLADALSISSERIRIEAFGETRPLTNPTGTKEQQAINRRVEIVIKPPKR